ncbi:MAG: hypothetical protein U1C19_08350 [Methanobacteriaceae archaeon]|jgi:hypothetical protein|nr:hypothetical protein [Methanobacteriaceae archaeon]
MKISKIADIKPSSNPHGVDARKIYDTKNAVAVHMTIKTWRILKKAYHPC